MAVTDGLQELAGKTIPGFSFHFTVTPLAHPPKLDQYLNKLHLQAAEHKTKLSAPMHRSILHARQRFHN